MGGEIYSNRRDLYPLKKARCETVKKKNRKRIERRSLESLSVIEESAMEPTLPKVIAGTKLKVLAGI